MCDPPPKNTQAGEKSTFHNPPVRRAPRTGTNTHTPTPQKRKAEAHGQVISKKMKLLRKEVIQPHLPVRLPCYDFVPIANPTFDHSLP